MELQRLEANKPHAVNFHRDPFIHKTPLSSAVREVTKQNKKMYKTCSAACNRTRDIYIYTKQYIPITAQRKGLQH